MDEKIVILGAGGHSATLYDILQNRDFMISAICVKDGYQNIHKSLINIQKVKQSDLSKKYETDEVILVNGVGKVNTNHIRDDLFVYYKKKGYDFMTVVHETAFISLSCIIGEGAHVMMGAHLGSNVKMGNNCIINSMSSIDHDCILGDNVHVAPGVTVCGGVKIEDDVMIGAGSTILPGVLIQKGSFIKAQSIVSENL